MLIGQREARALDALGIQEMQPGKAKINKTTKNACHLDASHRQSSDAILERPLIFQSYRSGPSLAIMGGWAHSAGGHTQAERLQSKNFVLVTVITEDAQTYHLLDPLRVISFAGAGDTYTPVHLAATLPPHCRCL